MSSDATEEEPSYRIEESDLAEADRTAAYLWLMSLHGPEYADSWHTSLLAAIQGLAAFPGPLANSIVRPAVAGRSEIRRLLYAGPKGRRSRMQARYRILYLVLPEAEGEEATAVIRILRILHSAAEGDLTLEGEGEGTG